MHPASLTGSTACPINAAAENPDVTKSTRALIATCRYRCVRAATLHSWARAAAGAWQERWVLRPARLRRSSVAQTTYSTASPASPLRQPPAACQVS